LRNRTSIDERGPVGQGWCPGPEDAATEHQVGEIARQGHPPALPGIFPPDINCVIGVRSKTMGMNYGNLETSALLQQTLE